MKRFSKYIISLVFILFILLFALESIYDGIYKHGLPRNKISYLMSLREQKIDYIFIGSSRVDNTIDADIISKITGKTALNLGIQSAKPDDYYLMLKLIKDLNIQTNKIFIQMDYVYNLSGNSKILNSYLMPYTENDIVNNHLKSTIKNSWFIQNLPFYKYLVYDYKIGFREFFSTAIHKPSSIDLKNGYFPKYGYSGAPLNGKLSGLIEEKNIYVDSINILGHKEHMEIIYFTAPFCPNTENIDFTTKLESKLPVLWNFSNYLKDDKYFYDCNHVNDSGAQSFTKAFADRINSYPKENL